MTFSLSGGEGGETSCRGGLRAGEGKRAYRVMFFQKCNVLLHKLKMSVSRDVFEKMQRFTT